MRDIMERVMARLALLAFAVLLALHADRFSGHTTDDAFISFRYAENLAQGRGLSYNPPARVEGFSNPLWVLLLAAGSRAGLELELLSKLLGLSAGLAALALAHLTARSLCDRPGSVSWTLAGGWLAASSAFAAWCVGGLETPLYALLVLAFPVALHRGYPRLAGVLAALLPATRPEGSLVVAAVLLGAWWQRRRDGPDTNPWLVPFAQVAIPLVLLVHGTRWAMFGHFMPNTVAAKATMATGRSLSALGYLHGAFVVYLPVPVLVLASAALSFRASEGPLFTVPPWIALAQLAVVAGVGGDWMPLYRLLIPLVPLTFVLAAAGLETVLGLIGPFLARMDRVAALVGVILCAMKLAVVPLEEATHVRMQSGLARLQERVGRHLTDRKGRVAVGDIGRIGFRSRLEVLDIKGLVSPEAVAAYRAGGGAGWVLDRGVEWIAILMESPRPGFPPVGFFPGDRELLRDRRLKEQYEVEEELADPEVPLVYRVYRRRDIGG
jgi:arabinofuranosyltransferase